MSYTFNDAYKTVDAFDEDLELESWMPDSKVYEIIDKLKQEYAPTILLTKNQYQEFKNGHTLEEKMIRLNRLSDNSSEDSADAYINDDMIMRAYLNPETIKVIDEEDR